MILVRPLGMILPGAVATISTVPTHAQPSARQKTVMIVKAIARPRGEGGVSVISRAAGRKASSCAVRRAAGLGKVMTWRLADVIDPSLHEMEVGVATVAPYQLVMGAVLDDAAALERDDAIGPADRGKPVGNDEHGAPGGDLLHVLL